MIRASMILLLLPGFQESSVREVLDLPYVEGSGADPVHHRLDLYLPKDAKKAPVVMYIHGGGWMAGDRKEVVEVGRRFAEAGVGFVAISYRLSPAVKHPAHVQDCARALAWLIGHAADYGGDPDRLFIAGHSAGGHLAALLAVDSHYLTDLKLPPSAIKGAIPISTPFSIPALPPDTRGPMTIFPQSFGSDPDACKAASPITYVDRLVTPMLIVTETQDADETRRERDRFKEAAEKSGVKSICTVDADHRSHNDIVPRLGKKDEDPPRTAILNFIKNQCERLDRVR